MSSVPHWRPSGTYPNHAVGVSYCRDEIYALVRNPRNKAAFAHCCAKLIPYDSNPYDRNAVRIEVDGVKVGHLSREMAVAFRGYLMKNFQTPITTSCDAIISGGIEVDGRSYEYTVDLDFNFEDGASHDISPAHNNLKKIKAHTITENPDDGYFYATGWLGRDALEYLDKNLDVTSWTTDDWSDVNYYIMHTKRCGIGHKFLSIPKDTHLRMFGNWEPSVAVTSLKGRHVTAKMIPSVTKQDVYWPALETNNVPEPQESNLPNSFTQTQWLTSPFRDQIYVWLHVDSNGVPFYVGRGRFSTAWTHHGRHAWEHYIKHHLGGKYHVVILKHSLTEIQAQSIVDSYSKEHAHILLDQFNSYRDANHEERKQLEALGPTLWPFYDGVRNAQTVEGRIEQCMQALEIQYAKEELNPHAGLYGKISREYALTEVDMFFIKPLIEDLVETGRVEEARDAIKRYLAKSGHSAERPTLQRLVKMAERGTYRRRKPAVHSET